MRDPCETHLHASKRKQHLGQTKNHFETSRRRLFVATPSRLFRVRFLFAVDIAWLLLLVARHKGWKAGCTGSCPLSVGEYGYKAGKKPATCRTCGKTFPRPNVTLSNFLLARGDGKKRYSSQSASLAMSRRSSWVSWSDSPCEQAVPSGEDTVMEACTESNQSEINRKIKANHKFRGNSRNDARRRQSAHLQ